MAGIGRSLTVPNFENASLEELAVAMGCTPSRQDALRIRGIWALGKGMSREMVALFCNVHEHTLIEWIKRFNGEGINGLIDRERRGAPRKISREQMEKQVIPLLNEPAKAGQEHWTAIKLHGHLTKELALNLSYPTLARYLHEHGYVTRIPRPMPEPADPQLWETQRQDFAQKLGQWLKDDAVELWFGDECGIEGDPRPRKRWVEKGSKPTIPYAGTHLRRNVIGAVCPQTGCLSTLIFSHCDTEIFQIFLDNLAKEVPSSPGKRQLLILDNASWHKSKTLNWHHFEPAYLPPYSPDFNPIERFWLRLKSDFFADFFTKKGDQLEERIVLGLQAFFAQPEKVKSNCAISGNF